MTRLRPDAHDLLATALGAFREEILPALPEGKRYTGLMIANALAMVERELAAAKQLSPEPAEAAPRPDARMPDEALEQRLIAQIDAAGVSAQQLREGTLEALKAINAARLAITNPKRLARK